MSGGVLKRQIVEFLLRGSLDAAKKASVDATLQELRRVRDGVEEQAARRGELEKRLKDIGFKHQAPDVVVLQDLCRALELPIAKSDSSGGLKRPELVEQIVVSLLAEVKAALVDKTLQELRRVRDGVEEQAARRGELEKRLKDIGFKHQAPDVVVLQDLCRALELPIAKSDSSGGLKRPELVEQIVVSLLAEVKAALVDKTFQELRRVRDGVEEHTARRGKLEKRLKDIGFKHQAPDVVVLQDLCHALELPIAKSDSSGGLKRPELVEQIVVSLLAEVKAALVDKTLQELRRVRDGVEEHTARRGKLEKRLKDIGFKNQTPDAVVLQDLCRALELPIAKSDGGGLKRPELVEQIVSTLMAEGVVPCSRVDQSCFGLAMELCRLVDGSQWDVDTAARQVCDTVERCVCVVAVLTGTEEEDLLGRHQGFGYWVERVVRLLPGFLQYTLMLRDSLPSDVPNNFSLNRRV